MTPEMPTQDVTEGIRNQKGLSDNSGHGPGPWLLVWSILMFTPNFLTSQVVDAVDEKCSLSSLSTKQPPMNLLSW